MKRVLLFISGLNAVGAAIFTWLGFDKMNNYYYSEYVTSMNKNAYVGGDAYNYIINGTYATAYFVLAGACYVALVLSILGICIIETIRNKQQSNTETENEIEE